MTVQSLFRIFSPFATASFAGMTEYWYILQCCFPKPINYLGNDGSFSAVLLSPVHETVFGDDGDLCPDDVYCNRTG